MRLPSAWEWGTCIAELRLQLHPQAAEVHQPEAIAQQANALDVADAAQASTVLVVETVGQIYPCPVVVTRDSRKPTWKIMRKFVVCV